MYRNCEEESSLDVGGTVNPSGRTITTSTRLGSQGALVMVVVAHPTGTAFTGFTYPLQVASKEQKAPAIERG